MADRNGQEVTSVSHVRHFEVRVRHVNTMAHCNRLRVA